jgi:hypothetical protein
MLRKIFQLKKDEVTGGLRKLRSEEFHYWNYSSNRSYYKDDKNQGV